MNQDISAGQWKQMQGELKSWWSKLTDDDVERIGGQKDKLIGWVQEKYGQTREHAQQEVEWRMQEMGGRGGQETTDATEAAVGMAAKAQEFGAAAMSTVSEAATAVGEQIGSLAGVIRDHAPQEGAIATAATAMAGGLASASTYLQEKEYANLAAALTALVRSYPVQALLVGVGLGYLVARGMKR